MSGQELIPQPSSQARQWAMFCHYSAFFWFLVPMIGNVLGPLIVWQLKKDMDPFVDEQGKEALNFQITFSILLMICGVLAWILIGFPLMALISVVALVLVVIAGIRANEGKPYRYPFCWRIVK
ncbi:MULTISPECIES: DUF4870 domain-containing protein [Pseudomonadaceae]|jgi:uncharacterized Tic20 family protein|uniref:Orotate phosphoribosyltransferase n=1 Tax=Stutzerimonas stutzeri TaxID=316 RepID=A0A0D9AU89_STUST|nr:DUF4870 domain-containing protein [Stutzerimonas stutzeri]KJH84595.1 orotate phosphoribosyltransferase [Stutzerimonas stutzeri]